MQFEKFNSLISQHGFRDGRELVVPVFKRLSADLLTPVSAYLALNEKGSFSFLLESVEGGEKLGRYSFLGKNPYCIVKATGNRVERTSRRENSRELFKDANVFTVLQEMLNRYDEVKVPELPRFSSGAVGFMGYDTVRLIESLPHEPEDDTLLPDAIWCFYDSVVAFDHVRRQLILMVSAFVDQTTDLKAVFDEANEKIRAMEAELNTPVLTAPARIQLTGGEFSSNMTLEQYCNGVNAAKNYIYEGDIFQVVLSQRFTTHFSGDEFNLYRALRQVNPSPYLFFLDFGEFSLVGSSPEVLVRVDDGRVELLPIAGTRPRGKSVEEDLALERSLLDDPKEVAEHVMLVDLGRNDLGRVCEFGTVDVEEYAYIERYSHVMHIVSRVGGQLAEERGAMDVLSACFPAGTLSGAPKVRAMQIIDELEPTKRGVYGGAVGYVDFSGNLDTCIAIRTMLVKGNRISIQAGAGIVADSVPETEFEETRNKARALTQAIEMASENLMVSR